MYDHFILLYTLKTKLPVQTPEKLNLILIHMNFNFKFSNFPIFKYQLFKNLLKSIKTSYLRTIEKNAISHIHIYHRHIGCLKNTTFSILNISKMV